MNNIFLFQKFNKTMLWILVFFTMFMMSAQEVSYGENQPYASYWFVENLLEWNPEKDKSAKFNTSIIPLASRFLNDSVSLGKGASKIPSIISLIAPHSTSNHPSQGFPSVKQYAFPYWQYIDYYVQWGGSANEGIIVPPLATWTDVAHRNGVKSIGTVFFPPNVYGGKEEWVYEFLVQRTDGSFPVADKLIEVANAYNFDGWFINQETYDLKDGIAEKMIAFLEYYKKNSNLKMVWYDAMIDDSRVIWQDELNNHNQVFFQKGAQKMSDVFFINFRYNPVNLEDSKKAAKALDRSEWDLYAGIDVQSRGYKTPIQWDALFNEETPKNTSIGLYWPNSTFDLSETKEPEDVYSKEQKFWNGGTEIETRFGKSKWRGFVNYFEPRSVINKLPFTTNFNYGLGRFYKEKGETVSDKEWHNLSVQDILPTWQWKVDSLKVKPTISFKDSYEGGSSLFLEGKSDAKIPLYKTNISLDKTVLFEVIAKSVGNMQLQFYYTLTNGEKIKFKLKRSSSWKKTSFTISSKKGIFITSVGVESSGVGDAFLGEISAYYKKPQKLPGTKFTAEVFKKVDTAEVYLHFEENTAEFHKIYAVLPNNEKVWLGKTPSQDYYISNAPIQNGYIHLATEPVGPGRVTGKLFYKKIRVD